MNYRFFRFASIEAAQRAADTYQAPIFLDTAWVFIMEASTIPHNYEKNDSFNITYSTRIDTNDLIELDENEVPLPFEVTATWKQSDGKTAEETVIINHNLKMPTLQYWSTIRRTTEKGEIYTHIIENIAPKNEIYKTTQHKNINRTYKELHHFKTKKDQLEEGQSWGREQYVHINKTDVIKEQIRARYGFMQRPSSGLLNPVVDTYFPGMLYAAEMDISRIRQRLNLPKTSVAISPMISNMLGIKRIPTVELCKVLGYTARDIKRILTDVKRKDLTFVFAGAGGTGMNTAYFFNELCKMTNTVNLFKKIYVYEKEQIEISNILRFPVDLRMSSAATNRKIDIIEPLLAGISRNKVELNTRYIGKCDGLNNFPSDIFVGQSVTDAEGKSQYAQLTRNNTIIYGAPSIETRNSLSDAGNFLCATHAATTCSIWINPKQDEDLQIESYGLIQLGGFFMNQLKMAIATLEYLGDPETNLNVKDTEILNYEFDGTLQLPTERQYNWQIDRNLLMMTENEAANI